MNNWLKDYDLTLEVTLQEQGRQLAAWGRVLKPEVFQRLSAYATTPNHLLEEHEANEVIRGTKLSEWVINYSNGLERNLENASR